MQKRSFIVLFCLLCLFTALKTNAQGSKDTVTVAPPKPTFMDSLHFDLYNANHSCCTHYYSKNVSVTDTVIMLSYEYEDSMCMCIIPGSHTQFSCGPQKVGKYGIYKAESMYCPPGQVCPLGPVMIKRVGEVTVYAPTSAVRERASRAAYVMSPISILRSSCGTILRLNLDRAQAVSVHVYSANGACLATLLTGQYFSQGPHSVDLKSLAKACGIAIIRVQGATFSASRIVDLSR